MTALQTWTVRPPYKSTADLLRKAWMSLGSASATIRCNWVRSLFNTWEILIWSILGDLPSRHLRNFLKLWLSLRVFIIYCYLNLPRKILALKILSKVIWKKRRKYWTQFVNIRLAMLLRDDTALIFSVSPSI